MVETRLGLDTLPDSARVWIYQSSRALTGEEAIKLEMLSNQFVSGWNAHGKKLSAGFEFLHNHFLVLSVDETVHGASGCSIDSSVDLIRHLNTTFNVDFLDRKNVAVLENETVKLIPLTSLKAEVESGRFTGASMVFNNLVPSLGDFRNNWLSPASETWLKRYFN